MCGIFFCSSIPDSENALLGEVANFIKHRGLLEPILYRHDRMLFAHALLPVQGASPVRQPLHSREGVLLFAGELWTHPQQQSDTLYLFDLLLSSSNMSQCMSELDGMFALLFFDERLGIVSFATDVFGEIPLYYAHSDERLVVATEVKQLVAFGIPVHKISTTVPGVLYRYNVVRNDLTNEDYHSFSFLNCDDSFSIPLLRELIQESVKKKYQSINLQQSALLLSGGLDSAIMAYELSQLGLRETYTVVVAKDTPDYRSAEAVCRKLGLNFNPVIAGELDPRCAIAVTEISNRSIVEEMCCHIILANQLGKRNVRVVFTGCGADELFVGYQHLLRYRSRETRSNMQREFVRNYYKMDLRAFNKAYMLNAIEVRHPFLSRSLLNYVSRFNIDTLLIGRQREMKLALRQAYADLLGDFVRQPKLIARETMGVKTRMRRIFGDSPHVYREMWKGIFQDSSQLGDLIERAKILA